MWVWINIYFSWDADKCVAVKVYKTEEEAIEDHAQGKIDTHGLGGIKKHINITKFDYKMMLKSYYHICPFGFQCEEYCGQGDKLQDHL